MTDTSRYPVLRLCRTPEKAKWTEIGGVLLYDGPTRWIWDCCCGTTSPREYQAREAAAKSLERHWNQTTCPDGRPDCRARVRRVVQGSREAVLELQSVEREPPA